MKVFLVRLNYIFFVKTKAESSLKQYFLHQYNGQL